MNTQRRNTLAKVSESLASLLSTVEDMRDEEQEAFDNLPENMQNGDKGTKIQEAIDAIESAASDIENAVANLETAVQ